MCVCVCVCVCVNTPPCVHVQGIDLSDGVTNVYVSGREFEDIYPVWDWRRLPGTIEAQAPMAHPGTGGAACEAFYHDLKAKHRTAFVGGASDGSVGITVADFRSRGELRVRRTWFMFDGVVVVANNGATTQTARHPASTSLDQRLVNGNATYALRTEAAPFVTPPIPLGAGAALATTSLAWIHHSDIGYVPLPTPRMAQASGGTLPAYTIRASLENRTGSWENITQGDANPVTKPVFTAFIDHDTGDHPADISSTYAIVPGLPVTSMQAALDKLDAQLSVHPGWNASVACFAGNSDEATTMMAALWTPNASGKASAVGCWDVMLVSVASAAAARGHHIKEQRCTGATPPARDMHCDLQHSTALSSAPSANSTDCAAKCCAVPRCSCWTWTPDEHGEGPYCMLKASNVPLIHATGLYGGTIPSRVQHTGVVVMVRSSTEGIRVYVADPSAQLTSVAIEISGRWKGQCSPLQMKPNASQVKVVLPDGQLAGSTVEIRCIPA